MGFGDSFREFEIRHQLFLIPRVDAENLPSRDFIFSPRLSPTYGESMPVIRPSHAVAPNRCAALPRQPPGHLKFINPHCIPPSFLSAFSNPATTPATAGEDEGELQRMIAL